MRRALRFAAGLLLVASLPGCIVAIDEGGIHGLERRVEGLEKRIDRIEHRRAGGGGSGPAPAARPPR